MLSIPEPTCVHRSTRPATADQRIGHAAVATYLGRLARRRIRRGFGPSTPKATQQPAEVAR